MKVGIDLLREEHEQGHSRIALVASLRSRRSAEAVLRRSTPAHFRQPDSASSA